VNDIGMWHPVLDKEDVDFGLQMDLENYRKCDETLFEVCSAKQL